jgi:hypothetical protein
MVSAADTIEIGVGGRTRGRRRAVIALFGPCIAPIRPDQWRRTRAAQVAPLPTTGDSHGHGPALRETSEPLTARRPLINWLRARHARAWHVFFKPSLLCSAPAPRQPDPTR